MDRDFELQWKDEQIAELRSALAGTITETGSYNPLEGKWEINTSSILTRLIQDALPNRNANERELMRYAWSGLPMIACSDECLKEQYGEEEE